MNSRFALIESQTARLEPKNLRRGEEHEAKFCSVATCMAVVGALQEPTRRNGLVKS